MASIKDSKLCPSGDDSFVGSETFLTDLNDSDLEELSESDLATINGGVVIPLAISGAVKLGLVVYGVYQAYQDSKEQKR
jgi:hypothetical protein